MSRSLTFALRATLIGAVVATVAACGSSPSSGTNVSASRNASARSSKDPSSSSGIPAGTVLNVGDQDQGLETLFKISGVEAKLPFKVNFVEFQSGPLVDAGFAAHRIDVGSMGDLPAALAIQSGLPVRAVNISQASVPDEYLIAKPGITSIRQLRGKSVAYTTGTAEQAFALRALASVGLRQSDVHQVDVSLQELFTVLDSGQVDASVIGGPELKLQYLKTHPGGKVLATDTSVQPPSYGYLLATTKALNNPAKFKAIEDFTKASIQAANWAYTHKSQYATDYMVDVEHETPAEAKLGVAAAVSGFDVPEGSKPQAALQDVVRLEVSAGAIKKSFSVAPLYNDPTWAKFYNKLLQEVHQDA